MNRRDFLKHSSLLTLSALSVPSLLLACRKKTLFEGKNYNGKVIIIGAGAAGLYAGYILKSKGIDFQIIEASATYGGRLGKLTGFADFDIDTGAQWLHGKNSILGDLIEKTNTTITKDESNAVYWFNNQLINTLPKSTDIFEGKNLLDISYKDYAVQKGLGDDYKYIIENIAGDQGAAASRISVFGNNQDEDNWSSGDNDFKFNETFYDLIDKQIAEHIKDRILLNTPITKINYEQGTVVITDINNNNYSAEKIIITVPITILKNSYINFTPSLPSNKVSAFSKIGMDAGMKVFLKFSSKFYNENIIGGKYSAAYADDTLGKTGSSNILLAFVMGEQAEYLTSLGSDAAITTTLLQELDAMYNGQATASFIASSIHNWTNHPFIKGAYSYSTIGMGNARQIASQTIDNKLYFAGEAMNINGHHQTVHGACETGYNAVIQILKSVKK
jgi:monoamine oxidase